MEKELLNILVCPSCKAAVKIEGDNIICIECSHKYEIKNGIAIMLIDQNEQLTGNH